ncbi:hypothetical protein ACJJIG_01445 [Microbulbifer sp. SSSA007]|uniref:hypothetical protein n=1 Tax=Microbulbifer sp. SSSA007 TaxID=3243379 RepID=UPI00403914D8
MINKIFFSVILVLSSVFAQSDEVVNQFNKKEFISHLNEDMDRLYSLSQSKTYDKNSSCKEAEILRKYLLKDPVVEANNTIDKGELKYLVVSGPQLEIVADGMPETISRQLINSGKFEVFEGVADSVSCGEQLYLTRYAHWYIYVYNSVLYINSVSAIQNTRR